MSKNILWGVTLFFISQRMGVQIKMNMTRRQTDIAKEMRAYILLSYVIYGDTWLHDLWGLDDSCLSYIPFEKPDDG